MEERTVITDDGVRLWVAVDGDLAAPAIAMCHGGPGLWDDLAPLAALRPVGTTSIRWEQRGCGRSDRVGPYAVDRSVADLEAIRAHLGIDRWIVAGHSFGASLALQYALAHPEATRAVLYLSGVGIGRAWNPVSKAEADRRLTVAQRARRDALGATDRTRAEEIEWRSLVWAPDYADRSQAMELAALAADRGFEVNVEANRTINDETRAWDEAALAARCRHLDVPFLIVHGREDPRPAWGPDSLAAALPRCEVRLLAGAGHKPWVETPDLLAASLAAFVDEHDLR